LKARLGDRRPLILGHIFDALLNMERDRAVRFVAEYLRSTTNELREEAALALGASRLPTAVRELMETSKDVEDEGFFDVVLRAISSSRQAEAIEFLIGVFETGNERHSAAAAEALKLHEGSAEIQALIEQAKKNRASGRS